MDSPQIYYYTYQDELAPWLAKTLNVIKEGAKLSEALRAQVIMIPKDNKD